MKFPPWFLTKTRISRRIRNFSLRFVFNILFRLTCPNIGFPHDATDSCNDNVRNQNDQKQNQTMQKCGLLRDYLKQNQDFQILVQEKFEFWGENQDFGVFDVVKIFKFLGLKIKSKFQMNSRNQFWNFRNQILGFRNFRV